jgi:hypothetical protein
MIIINTSIFLYLHMKNNEDNKEFLLPASNEDKEEFVFPPLSMPSIYR